jgi:hypothetical protein
MTRQLPLNLFEGPMLPNHYELPQADGAFDTEPEP